MAGNSASERQEQSLVRALRLAVSSYDGLTGRHSGRVGSLAGLLATQLDLASPDRLIVAHAGVLHDLGKLGLSPEVLVKEGRLTPEETEEVQRHPIIGAKMLLAISPALASMAAGVRAHHERWDGAGYPDGLAGEAIPVFGRVLAVVDVYDALTHPRSYRKTIYSAGRARAYLQEHVGTYFDPDCVSATLDILRAKERGRRQFPV
ncbi:MAG: HD-GYP domain-containing protein [Acidimicrobiales bacterium]|jgi:putative two-component system response regulator